MFYSVLALIIFESYSTSKHSGVLSYFHQHFIKERVFPESFGRMFQKAFEMRNTGDYQELSDPTAEKTEPLLKDAYLFVEEITVYLKNSHGI